MKIELSSIDNKQTQENFKELKAEFDTNPLLKADMTFFARTYIQAGTYSLPHGLRYKPRDVLVTFNNCGAVIDHSLFSKESISITVSSAGELRFLLGRIA